MLHIHALLVAHGKELSFAVPGCTEIRREHIVAKGQVCRGNVPGILLGAAVAMNNNHPAMGLLLRIEPRSSQQKPIIRAYLPHLALLVRLRKLPAFRRHKQGIRPGRRLRIVCLPSPFQTKLHDIVPNKISCHGTPERRHKNGCHQAGYYHLLHNKITRLTKVTLL